MQIEEVMSKPLKTLIWHWGRRGGGPRYTLELARVLATRQDMEIYLSLSRQSEIYADFECVQSAGRFDINTYEGILQFGLRSIRLPMLKRRFARYIREQKIDVVFCTMDHLWGAFLVSAIRDSDAVYLLTVHDATRHPGEDQGQRRWLLRRDINASDSALVLTRSVGLSLQANYSYPADRVFLSAHGHFGDGSVNVEVRSLPTDRPVRLLFFGRILQYKGLDLMLEVLPLLRREFPGLQLEVWGNGDINPYQSAIEAVGGVRVENRWIEESEIPQIFASTDLGMLPYREASQSGVVATAFALGMPCVATPVPGLCEQISDGVTGIISNGFGAAEYAEAVARVLRDPVLYTRLSQNCITVTKTTLSWDCIGQSVVDALRGAYAKGKRGKEN
ncbi:glycosyltransferase family 4 protein [Haematospirillum sp. 15-248]|uniref:glycosyltransferase family 4 protein n=1 Tax=Haematospirillum sp. 15-248 TaxID=2723107 RepID=UPI0014392EBC|nr:glycosyltransferase family 4 protein [Haematospirillum sp. 15-248]NKD88718.1 glycosyltransferase family 4 protein [Haematospirillum sp. 15-248]